ncbi:hypothetical protein, partial [Sutcliffiella cohnii]|uniref:hypothetical protein n=1 Tax=Sutcliffiella cohnii TaxID=33932 RepID=UPI0014703CB8
SYISQPISLSVQLNWISVQQLEASVQHPIRSRQLLQIWRYSTQPISLSVQLNSISVQQLGGSGQHPLRSGQLLLI